MKGEFFGMDPDQFGWMAEAEGESDLIDTRETKVNSIINELGKRKRENPSVDPMHYIDEVIEKNGIKIKSLTESERRAIDRHI